MSQQNYEKEYALLSAQLKNDGIDVDAVEKALKAQHVETPSWGFADSGTRFGVFRQAGAASTVEEKIADAAQAHKHTGIAPSVALHIPWDMVADWSGLAKYAAGLGVSIGAINPNVFQDFDYRFGSFGNEDKSVRQRAIAHMLECVDIMNTTGTDALSLWFADGTSYPGQGNFRRRKHYFEQALSEIHGKLSKDQTLLLEYKPFEPAFYHTDIADWGMAAAFCRKLGSNAKVLVDLGHHLPGANIEHIVSFLLDEGLLGGFHLNGRKYADDDLTTGSINPYELFLIYHQLAAGERDGIASHVAYMIDESHTIKNKIAEMIQSLVAIQTAYAKALVINWNALKTAQETNDVIGAEEILKRAYATDIRPILWKVRSEQNIPDPADPVRGFIASGYIEDMAAQRGTGKGSGLGA